MAPSTTTCMNFHWRPILTRWAAPRMALARPTLVLVLVLVLVPVLAACRCCIVAPLDPRLCFPWWALGPDQAWAAVTQQLPAVANLRYCSEVSGWVILCPEKA